TTVILLLLLVVLFFSTFLLSVLTFSFPFSAFCLYFLLDSPLLHSFPTRRSSDLVGIASNRGSACHGESVPGPCTHRPSHHESSQHPKSVRQPFRSEPPKEGQMIGVKS